MSNPTPSPTPSPVREIFAGIHNPKTTIRVVYGRNCGDGSLGLDVVLSGVVAARFYSPEEVSAWFGANSKKLLDPWKAAYHQSGLSPSSYKRPQLLDVTLNVPYFSQRDNADDPLSSCNVTAYAMGLTFKGAKHKFPASQFPQFEDELAHFLAVSGRSRIVHEDLAWMGRQYGFDCRFSLNRTLDEMRAQIRGGNPVIVSGTFTRAGHIVILIGTKGDDFIVNDPYGNALSSSKTRERYADHDGKRVVYSGEWLMEVLKAPGQPAKRGHFLGGAL